MHNFKLQKVKFKQFFDNIVIDINFLENFQV